MEGRIGSTWTKHVLADGAPGTSQVGRGSARNAEITRVLQSYALPERALRPRHVPIVGPAMCYECYSARPPWPLYLSVQASPLRAPPWSPSAGHAPWRTAAKRAVPPNDLCEHAMSTEFDRNSMFLNIFITFLEIVNFGSFSIF